MREFQSQIIKIYGHVRVLLPTASRIIVGMNLQLKSALHEIEKLIEGYSAEIKLLAAGL
jgi:hypothetical protein